MNAIERFLALTLTTALVLTPNLGCSFDAQPEITKGVDGCTSCGMTIDKVNEAAGYYVEKEFNPFCSPGCLVQSFEQGRSRGKTLPERIYFADYLGAGLRPADSTVFLLTKHIPSVMGWGIIGFADSDAARSRLRHEDERVVDWIGLRTVKGKPDRTVSLVFEVDGTVPKVVELSKGELVEWEITGRGLDRDMSVHLRGYEELGRIDIPASGEPVRIRLLATKPGAGFPFVRGGDGKVLGQVRVAGSHTPEEEDM